MQFSESVERLLSDVDECQDSLESAWLINDFIFALQKAFASAIKDSNEFDPDLRASVLERLIQMLSQEQKENLFKKVDSAISALRLQSSEAAGEAVDALERYNSDFKELSKQTGAESPNDRHDKIIKSIESELSRLLSIPFQKRFEKIQSDIKGMPSFYQAEQKRQSQLDVLQKLGSISQALGMNDNDNSPLRQIKKILSDSGTVTVGYRPNSQHFEAFDKIETMLVESQVQIEGLISRLFDKLDSDELVIDEGERWKIDFLFLTNLLWQFEEIQKLVSKDNHLSEQVSGIVKKINFERAKVNDTETPVPDGSKLFNEVNGFLKSDKLNKKTLGEKNALFRCAKKIIKGLLKWFGFKRRQGPSNDDRKELEKRVNKIQSNPRFLRKR